MTTLRNLRTNLMSDLLKLVGCTFIGVIAVSFIFWISFFTSVMSFVWVFMLMIGG